MQQLTLPLTHYPYQEYLGGFKRVRRAIGAARNAVSTWKQLELEFVLRRLRKGGVRIILNVRNRRIFRIDVPSLTEIIQGIARPFINLLKWRKA